MASELPPFLNYRALCMGALLLAILTLVMISLALLLGVEQATAPQLLTLSALWAVPGVMTALQAKDGRLLHGMVMGMLGALLVVLLVYLLLPLISRPIFLQQLTGDKSFAVIILGGFWGGVGGIFAEIMHLRRSKKNRKPGR